MVVDYDHVAEFLHELEVIPCAEEIGFAYVLGDFGLVAVACGLFEQEVAAADIVVGTGVLAVALGHGVLACREEIHAAFVFEQVGAFVGMCAVVNCPEVGKPVIEYVGERFEVAGLAPQVAVGELVLWRQVEARC